MRTAIYARVSTTDQKCEMQLTELREYIIARKWELVKEYVDEGYSGASSKRPALKECLRDAKLRKFDCVIVWKLDRWGRTVIYLSADIQTLDSAGVRFISFKDGIDTDINSPTSRFLRNILAAVAEFERDVIKERVSAGFKLYRDNYNQGKNPVSRSKKNLPIGRPKKIFDRLKIKELRDLGKSWGEIALETGLTKPTIRRAYVEVSNANK